MTDSATLGAMFQLSPAQFRSRPFSGSSVARAWQAVWTETQCGGVDFEGAVARHTGEWVGSSSH
jgi:hypothetical protein